MVREVKSVRPRISQTSRGVCVSHQGTVITELLRSPGPTHGFFDVIAGAVHCFSPGPRVGVLGFAYGGIIAPLRAMGGGHHIEGVDFSRAGFSLFRRWSKHWAGSVNLVQEEATAWLRQGDLRYDLLLEDLSEHTAKTVRKPRISFEEMPRLLSRRLRKNGVLLVNLLRPDDRTWSQAIEAFRHKKRPMFLVSSKEYENRLIVTGPRLGNARGLGAVLRARLAEMGSRQHRCLGVRCINP